MGVIKEVNQIDGKILLSKLKVKTVIMDRYFVSAINKK
jgi:hypothetical protein